MTLIETSRKNPCDTWTAERIEQLKSGFGAGLSCAQIANEIGVSRNAVIGKLNRLGLSRGRSPGAPRARSSGGSIRRPQVLTQRLLLKAVFASAPPRSEEHTSELQSLRHLVCRL